MDGRRARGGRGAAFRVYVARRADDLLTAANRLDGRRACGGRAIAFYPAASPVFDPPPRVRRAVRRLRARMFVGIAFAELRVKAARCSSSPKEHSLRANRLWPGAWGSASRSVGQCACSKENISSLRNGNHQLMGKTLNIRANLDRNRQIRDELNKAKQGPPCYNDRGRAGWAMPDSGFWREG